MGIDLIGSGDKIVAVVDIGKKPKREIEKVVQDIVKHNKNVKSVVERTYGVRGKFRLSKHRLVWGNKNTEVLHREHGYVLKLDPSFVYFSPRESTVRQHVSNQVKPNERVLVMFAGACPYAISICKKQPRVREVVAVEFNPKAVDYMKENVRRNKVSHLVTPILGEVREACENFGKEFDRIIMPMLYAKDYVDVALKCAKKNGMIHIYMVSLRKDFKDSRNFISKFLGKLKKKYKIEGIRKIGVYAPGKWKILMDIRLK